MPAADAPTAHPWRACAAASTLSAIAFGLSFPLSDEFVAGWPLAFVWPALLAIAAKSAPRARTLAACVGTAYLAAFLAHEWWMRHITDLGMPVLALYLAAWMALLALAIRALTTGSSGRWPFALAVPAALVAIEFLRGDLVCSGYAWFFAAHPLVEWTTVAQVASLGGGWLLTGLVGFVAGAAVEVIHARGRARIAWPMLALAALVSAHLYGRARIDALDGAEAMRSESPRFLVMQTNLPMSNKIAWSVEAQAADFRSFAQSTLDAAAEIKQQGGRIDLVLWPETTVPGIGFEADSLKTVVDNGYYPGDRYLIGLRALAREIGAPLLVGSPAYLGLRVEGNRYAWDRQFNSAYLVNADGVVGRTDKIYLTPFGETMPIISNWDWLEAQLLALGAEGMTFDLDAAGAPAPIPVPGRAGSGGSIGVPICFEITMPWASRRIVFPNGERAVGVVANLSNDGWFGASRAGRRQHLQVAQLRAIELDTPVIRCANTGMSASIDACGRVEARLGAEASGYLACAPISRSGRPLAAILGDALAILSLCAVCAGIVASRPKRCALGRQESNSAG